MGSHMKATLEISDAVLERAKALAAREAWLEAPSVELIGEREIRCVHTGAAEQCTPRIRPLHTVRLAPRVALC